MERALHHPRLLARVRRPQRQHPHARSVQLRRAVVGARGLDHPLGADPFRLHRGRRPPLPVPPHRPARRMGARHDARGRGVLLLSVARPREPVHRGAGRHPDGRPGPEPAAAEPHPHGVPPADALPRLRRVHRSVRVRDRGPRSPDESAKGGCSRHDAGRSSRGDSSPSASSSARGGATRCSGGAATGRGTPWRTRRSCRGSRAPHTCTR